MEPIASIYIPIYCTYMHTNTAVTHQMPSFILGNREIEKMQLIVTATKEKN